MHGRFLPKEKMSHAGGDPPEIITFSAVYVWHTVSKTKDEGEVACLEQKTKHLFMHMNISLQFLASFLVDECIFAISCYPFLSLSLCGPGNI